MLLILFLMANFSTLYTSYGNRMDLRVGAPKSSLLVEKKNLIVLNSDLPAWLKPTSWAQTVSFYSLDLSASAHSKVVIFTVNSLGSSQSYLGVVQSNVDLFRALVPALGHYSQHSVLLVASQPGKRFYFKWSWWSSASVELPFLMKVIKLNYKGTAGVFS